MLKKIWKRMSFRKKLWLDVTLVAIACFFIITGMIIFWISTFKIPSLDSFEQRKITQSTKIYDKTSEVLLYDVYDGIRRTVVPFEQISKNIKNATVAIEDKGFYNHGAIKISSFFRAIVANVTSGSFSQGGSTITQQVVKNSLLSGEKSIARKLKEWVLAIKLEQVMSKDDILNLYLNEMPYGGSIYGVEEASQSFFGKKSSDVTLAEAAYLASLLQAPTFYSPYGKNKEKLEERKNLVLVEMLSENFITKEEYDSARSEQVIWRAKDDLKIKAPHFVQFIREQVESKYGQDVLQNGGLKIITTLDYKMQLKAEEIVKKYALENKEKFDAENAALVAIDPKTGGILVMVGSRDYFDEEIDGNYNVVTAKRQPGSSFKPFAYAEAFNKGYTPETLLFDVETEFSTECNPDGTPKKSDANCYRPGNYDDKFRGPMTMRQALAQSINIPAIKTLYLAGTQNVLELAQDMGITTLTDIGRYGLTLVLGGGEVSPLDMTSAYSVFANNGDRNPYQYIQEIRDKNGNTIEKAELRTKNVLPKNTALMISNILTDNAARMPSYGAQSPLYFPGRDVAVKTGTTNDYRDVWIIGYTPSIAVGAWAGNNSNKAMEKKVAGLIIAPMWRAFMDEIFKDMPAERFPLPEIEDSIDLKPVLRGKWQGGVSVLVDKASGKLATNNTPEDFVEERLTGGVHSILYWVNKNDPRGPIPTNPDEDSQFKLWEYAVQKWAKDNGKDVQTISIPTSYDDTHSTENAPQVNITSPIANGLYGENDAMTISFGYSGKYAFKKADYYLNNKLIISTEKTSITFIPNSVSEDISGAKAFIKVAVYDIMGNKTERALSFRFR